MEYEALLRESVEYEALLELVRVPTGLGKSILKSRGPQCLEK